MCFALYSSGCGYKCAYKQLDLGYRCITSHARERQLPNVAERGVAKVFIRKCLNVTFHVQIVNNLMSFNVICIKFHAVTRSRH